LYSCDLIDVERRNYALNSGWPNNYEEVAQCYRKAIVYCATREFDFSVTGSLEDRARSIPELVANGDAEANLIESYNLPSNFCASNRNKLRRSEYVRVIKHALPMLKDAVGDQITTVEFATRSGKTAQVNTQLLVLALGGSKPRVFCLRRILQALGSETNPTAWDVTTPAISRISWGS
jgi:hypothetical protein